MKKSLTGKNANNWRGGPTKKLCVVCRKPFYITPANADKRKSCSWKCVGIFKSKTFIGKNSPRWNGGKTTCKGYIVVLQPNHPSVQRGGYVREHRLVMEKYLGRYLKPKEVVHHINHDKADNRIENLILYSSHSKHMKLEKHPHAPPKEVLPLPNDIPA